MLRWTIAILIAVAGCGGGSTRPPCNTDEDCAQGTFCRSGVGCDFECRLDVDCGGRTCDVARGRCADSSMDGGADAPDAPACGDCDDGLFCNGVERCGGAACVAGEPPCPAGECDESADRCEACLDPDRDDDGFDSVACGGRDCDDDDPRIPRQEVCDAANVDEDCDPTTVGSLVLDDGDDDGFLPTTCCNDTDAGLVCGTDCDDTNNAVYPGATDVCDGVDNDCMAPTDPGCGCTAGDTTMCGYSAPPGCAPVIGRCTTAGAFDCPSGLVTGGETETCNGLDDNCNGAVDESVPGIGSACYTGPPTTRGRGICLDGTQACVGGAPQCTGQVTPASETCVGVARGRDDDCDGSVDEGLINACGHCTEALPAEMCNGVDDNCDGVLDPGECTLGTNWDYADTACGAPVRRTCEARDTHYCQWGPEQPRTGALGYVYDINGPEPPDGSGMIHDRTCSFRDTDGSWSVRDRPYVDRPVCPDFIASPLENRLPAAARMTARVYIRWSGCVRFQIEVTSAWAGRRAFVEHVRCGDGGDFFVLDFDAPSRSGGCAQTRIHVRAVDIPSSQIWVSWMSMDPRP